jgi:hypothetical protein
VNWNVAPSGALTSAQILPPCASLIERQIDRPMPMPLDLVVSCVEEMLRFLGDVFLDRE